MCLWSNKLHKSCQIRNHHNLNFHDKHTTHSYSVLNTKWKHCFNNMLWSKDLNHSHVTYPHRMEKSFWSVIGTLTTGRSYCDTHLQIYTLKEIWTQKDMPSLNLHLTTVEFIDDKYLNTYNVQKSITHIIDTHHAINNKYPIISQ